MLAAIRNLSWAEGCPPNPSQAEPVLRRFIASGRDIAAGGAGRLPPIAGEGGMPA